MSRFSRSATPETCESDPISSPTFETIPGRLTELGNLPIRRLLPRSQRRMVGAWCFLDSFGPLQFAAGKPMDVGPHPHIGLQTVSWLLEGEVLHHDSLGLEGLGKPGTLNLMTAGRGIAHAEETPPHNSGRLAGVQLWVALPDRDRETEPAFESLTDLPAMELDGGRAFVFLGRLGAAQSRARVFSPIVGAELRGAPGRRVQVPIERDFEHAIVPLSGESRLDGHELEPGTLYYLGCGRNELMLDAGAYPARWLLLGGVPFGETVLMWWNFVARTNEELVAAREDWQAGRRFGEVHAYQGDRIEAPPFIPRSMSGR